MKKVFNITGARERMRKQGIRTVAELAERAGVSRVSASMWLSGVTQPSLPSLERLADVFGLSTIDALLTTHPTEGNSNEVVSRDKSARGTQ